MTNIDTIKNANPVADILIARGVKLRPQGRTLVCRCPIHSEQNGSSFTIWPDANRWHCFGKCAAGGDVIELVMRLDRCNFMEAVEKLGGNHINVGTGISTVSEKRPPSSRYVASPILTREQVLVMHHASRDLSTSPSKCEEIARRRGWKPQTVRGLAQEGYLGVHHGKLAFIFDHGLKIRWRGNDGGRRIAWTFGGNGELWRGGLLHPLNEYSHAGYKRVWVSEGETDAISLIDAGLEDNGESVVVALPCAGAWNESWKTRFAGHEVVLVLDADAAGEKAAERIERELDGIVAKVCRVNLKEILGTEAAA